MNLSSACVLYVYKNSTIETMANSTARWEPGPFWPQSTVAFLYLQGWTEQNTSPGSLTAQNVCCSETLFQVKVLKIGLQYYSSVLSRGWVLVFRASFLLAPWKIYAWGKGSLITLTSLAVTHSISTPALAQLLPPSLSITELHIFHTLGLHFLPTVTGNLAKSN